MGIIRVTPRPGYYASMTGMEEATAPVTETDNAGMLTVSVMIGGLNDLSMTRQQSRIHRALAESMKNNGRYTRAYEYEDDRGYYSWDNFKLHQNILTSGLLMESEISILEKPLAGLAQHKWYPEDIVITYYPENRSMTTIVNLITILESRTQLIEQALQLKEPLQILMNRGLAMCITPSSFSFPAIEAAACLIVQANKMALSTKKARMAPCDMSNPKFQMRSWLLRLGFIGEQFERPRKTLLEGLSGDMAFFKEDQKKIAVARRKAKKMNMMDT